MDQRKIWDARYSKSAGDFEKDRWIEQYKPYISDMKSYTVVDLGCGRGAYSLFLKEHGYNVIACDFSPIAIEFVNNVCPAIETRCLDMIKEFPYDITNAGIVFASLSTHYFSLSDTCELYKNIRNILIPGGYFIFRVNSKKELENKDKPHIKNIIEKDYYELDDGTTKRYFDIDSVCMFLNGLSIEKISEVNNEYHGSVKYFIECVAKKV